MKLYSTKQGIVVEDRELYYQLPEMDWDDLFNLHNLEGTLTSMTRRIAPLDGEKLAALSGEMLPPLGTQEVWAAGVTYKRSRQARMEESQSAGGGDFYDRVYAAPRPEIFFKATPHRVVGTQGEVRIRRDARWSVPEPELVLAINAAGQIFGYTIGNDMSSRDIEGENPLYLPQAKIYDGSCGLGPGILISDEMLAPETEIRLEIERGGKNVFTGSTHLSELNREPQELVEYLFREASFPRGCFLLTGTGIIPPDEFTLEGGDEIRITIEPIGTLVNRVAR